MRDATKPLPRLREGDRVMVRRVDKWVAAEVVSCANGLVWVRWGSQTRFSWRPSRCKGLPWTCAVPCDASYLRRDHSGLPLTAAQRRALERQQHKMARTSDLDRETRFQQLQYARTHRSEAEQAEDDANQNRKANTHEASHAVRHTFQSDRSHGKKDRNSSNAHTIWSAKSKGSGSSSSSSKGYAYAIYKGKRCTVREIESLLAAQRKRSENEEEAARRHLQRLREELLLRNRNDPDEYEVEEAYYASDIISEYGDDSPAEADQQWGAEEDLAEGWDRGAHPSSFQGRSVGVAGRGPRRQRSVEKDPTTEGNEDGQQALAWEQSADADAEPHRHDERQIRNSRKVGRRKQESEDDDRSSHHAPSGSAVANDNGDIYRKGQEEDTWANPYDMPSFGDTPAPLSLSDFGGGSTAWTTTAADHSFTIDSDSIGHESLYYGVPESSTRPSFDVLRDLAPPASYNYELPYEDAPHDRNGTSVHTFNYDFCAPAYSDTLNTSSDTNASSSNYSYNDNDSDNHSDKDNGRTASNDYESGSGEEDDENEGLGGLFSNTQQQSSDRKSSSSSGWETSSLSSSSPTNNNANARKPRMRGQAHQPAKSSSSIGAGRAGSEAKPAAEASNGGKAVVLDAQEMKRRRKWEVRQVKRDEFKRRQRELKRGSAQTTTA